jgi:O-antigen/teichoic acid export membrane protein
VPPTPAPQRLSRNTVILLISNGGSAALSFLLSALIGRALGKTGLGVYSTALAWVFPLSLIAEFGLGTLMTRDLASEPGAAAAYLRAVTWVRLWLGGGLVSALVLAAPLLSTDPALVIGLQVSAPLIMILPFFGAFTAIFRAAQSMWPIPWLNIGMLAAQVALTALVLLWGGDVVAALVVNTATSAGQLAAAWGVYRWGFAPGGELPHPRFAALDSPSPTWREGGGVRLLRRAWPFAVAAVLAALQARLGTILLERLTDAGQVGYYAAATRFVEAARMIPNALFGALFPALAALAQHPPEMRRLFRRVLWGLLAFGGALAVLFVFVAEPLLRLTYGEAFTPAAMTLIVAMGALLPALLRAGRTLYWYAVGQEGRVNRVTGVTLILQMVLSLWLIPAYGALGLALVMLVTEEVGLVLLWPGQKSS